MDIKLISKYRAQIMGFAIIMVSIFHSSVVRTNDAIDMLCFSGDMGVDIFFLVSGLGMYYTFLKQPSLGEFYKKRLIRIVPTWWFMIIITELIDNKLTDIDWLWFFKKMTGLSFWMDRSLYYWYIPVLLFFYFITPFFIKKYKEDKLKTVILFGSIIFLCLMCSLVFKNAKYFIVIFRIPSFFLGIWIGDMAYHEKAISKKLFIIPCIMFIIGMYVVFKIKHLYPVVSYIRYDFKFIAYIVTAISLCMILAKLFVCTNYKFPILKFLGGITLEIYLLHEMILKKVTDAIGYVPFDSFGIIFNLLVWIGVVLIAKAFHEAIAYLEKIIINNRKKEA